MDNRKAAQLRRKSRKQPAVPAKAAGIRVGRRATRGGPGKAIVAAGARQPAKPEEPTELPREYGRSRLVLMEVEPRLIHAYWEITSADARAASGRLGIWSRFATWILRFYDVTCVHFDGTNYHRFFDVPIDLTPGNWYVHLWEGEKTYLAEIGPRAPNGRFVPVCRSNLAFVPRADASPRYAPQWMRVDAGRAQLVAEPAPRPAGGGHAHTPERGATPLPSRNPGKSPLGDDLLNEQFAEIPASPVPSVESPPPPPVQLSPGAAQQSEVCMDERIAVDPIAHSHPAVPSSDASSSFGLGSGSAVFPFTRAEGIERPAGSDPALLGKVGPTETRRLHERWVESKSGRFRLQSGSRRRRQGESHAVALPDGKQRLRKAT